jgi:hypothetical protein
MRLVICSTKPSRRWRRTRTWITSARSTIASIERAGYEVGPTFITAIPHENFNLSEFGRKAAPATRTVEEGDIIDLGNRRFEVLHLPGHSPGSDIPLYIKTMRRLEMLPARIVHAGHDASFDGRRLSELARAYLDRH